MYARENEQNEYFLFADSPKSVYKWQIQRYRLLLRIRWKCLFSLVGTAGLEPATSSM
jgi:hypothetical protein